MSYYDEGRLARQGAAGIRDWLNTRFPIVLADADEVPDPVGVETDYTPSFAASVVLSEPTACLGISCPFSSDACDACKFGGLKAEDADADDEEGWDGCDSDLTSPERIMADEPNPYETRYGTMLNASKYRGYRMHGEQRFSGRAGF